MRRRQRKMVALKVAETSGVDHPAHAREGWIVKKNATDTETIDDVDIDEEGIVTDDMADEAGDLELTDDEIIERFVELEAEITKARDERDEALAALEAVRKNADSDADTEDDVLKALPDGVREVVAKAIADAEAARAEVAKAREAEERRQFVAKAAEWNSLSFDAETFGGLLQNLHAVAPDLAAEVEKALTAANARVESADIFTEIGTSGDNGSGDAFQSIQALAKSRVEKGESATIAQAIAEIAKTNPTLYTKYLAETRG